MLTNSQKCDIKESYAKKYTVDELMNSLGFYHNGKKIPSEILAEVISYYMYEMPRHPFEKVVEAWIKVEPFVGKAYYKRISDDEFMYIHFDKCKMHMNNYKLEIENWEDDEKTIYVSRFFGLEYIRFERYSTIPSWDIKDFSIIPECTENIKFFSGMKEISVDYYNRLKSNIFNQYKVLTEKTAEDISKESML